MFRRRIQLVLGLALLTGACASDVSRAGSTPPTPTDARSLHAAVLDQVSSEFDLATFVIDEETSVVGTSDRVYSFDSITKTVVALVLARLDESGAVPMSTPVGTLLDAGSNGDVTLEQLASHSSGLPRLAPNADEWPGFDPQDPYAGYTAEMAEKGLRTAERGPNEYSNFGFQVLGLALERATSRPLGELAADLVFRQAGMNSAALRQGPTDLPNGSRKGRPAPHWTQLLGGAGGVTGTIDDLAAYAQMMLDPPAELAATVARVVEPRGSENGEGLGWATTRGLTWHNGGSYGYASLVALDLENNRAAGYLAATGDLERESEELVFRLLLDLRD